MKNKENREVWFADERLTGGSVRLDCLAVELALETIYDEVGVQ